MKRLHALPAIAALIGVTAVGCQSISPLKTGLAPSGLAMAEQDASGRIVVRIKWPQSVQAMPTSTQAIVLKTYRKGLLVNTETLVRGEGTAIGSKTLRLPADTGYFMEAMAYAESTPGENSIPVAMGSSGTFAIGSNTVTSVPISLGALGPQANHGGLSIGGAGLMIPLTASYLRTLNELSDADSIEVWFGNAKSPEVKPDVTDKTKRLFWAKVPTGVSGSQGLKVKVNGVMTPTIANFTILDKLSTALKDYSVDANSHLTMSTFVYGYSQNNSYTTGQIPYPALAWKSSNPSVAFVAQDGKVYGLKAGQATITAYSGSLSTSFNVTVNARQGSADLEVGVPSSGAGSATMPIELPAYGGTGSGTVQH